MKTRDDPAFGRAQAGTDMTGQIDITAPHSARVWDYWLGGKNNYEVDRQAGDKVLAAFPGIAGPVRQLRCFTGRVVRYLAAEAGIRQFLDIGTGFPFRDPVHEIALAAAPGCRIAYADNDALVLSHARALLTGPPGTVTHVAATLHDPAALLAAARDWLDFTQPAAILLMSTLGHVGNPGQDDDHAARAITTCLKDALAPGSYLAIGDLASHPRLSIAMDGYNTTRAAPYRLRTPGQLARFFEGLELTSPGPEPATRRRPAPSPLPELPAWGALGRKR